MDNARRISIQQEVTDCLSDVLDGKREKMVVDLYKDLQIKVYKVGSNVTRIDIVEKQ